MCSLTIIDVYLARSAALAWICTNAFYLVLLRNVKILSVLKMFPWKRNNAFTLHCYATLGCQQCFHGDFSHWQQ